MRIKVKTLKTLVFAGILAIGGIFAGGMISKKASTHRAYGEAEQEYCCGDIIFGEDVDNPTDNAAINKSNADSIVTYSVDSCLSTGDFTVTFGSNTAYEKPANGKYYSAKIGGSKSGKYAGTITVNLNGYECDQVFVWAAGWLNDDPGTLNVNEVTNKISAKTTSSYTYNKYVFGGFEKTNTIKISNNNATSKNRIVISKITFKLYKAN